MTSSDSFLNAVPRECRSAGAFLLEHMPERDRSLMSPDGFLEHVETAWRVRHATPCGMEIPEDIWLNDVLPHRFLDEPYAPWRKRLHTRFVEQAHRAASIEDAVFMLNQEVFTAFGVDYNPKRRPRQNPGIAEIIEGRFTDATGLSMLLAAACRAVGLPARLAGVRWADGTGTHTWVEIWDRGQWRTVAAREGFAFDETWFNDKVRGQDVFAVSYRPTNEPHPLPTPAGSPVHAVRVSDRYRHLPPTPAHPTRIIVEPRGYLAPRIAGELKLTGRLDDPAWEQAPWTEYFVDIEGHHKPTPRFHTRAKILWSKTCLYVGARLEAPHVWATLTEKNSIIFNDPDFEIFIDPDGDHHHYYEFEVNALGTIWELALERPYRDGGPVHRGRNLPGLRHAVHVAGALNDPSVQDRGWSVEVAIPWGDLAPFRNGASGPPQEGEQWKMNFSRVDWLADIIDGAYRKVPRTAHPEDNWVWSPQMAIDMHRPERWGVVQFGGGEFRPDETWPAREVLMEARQAGRPLNPIEVPTSTGPIRCTLSKDGRFLTEAIPPSE